MLHKISRHVIRSGSPTIRVLLRHHGSSCQRFKRSPRRQQKTNEVLVAFGSLLECSFCWGTVSHLTMLIIAEADVSIEAELCKCCRKEGAVFL